jgi:WD40 repeat protein
LLVAVGQETVTIWDVARRTVVAGPLPSHPYRDEIHSRGGVVDVALSPDGGTLVTAGGEGTIRLWDVARGAALGEPLKARGVNSLAFSPDGRTFASAGREGTLLWDSLLVAADLETWRKRLCSIVSRNFRSANGARSFRTSRSTGPAHSRG